MNLRTMTKSKLNKLSFSVSFFAGVSASAFFLAASAALAGSNTLSLPVTVSFPSSSAAIETSIVRLGNSKFKEGFELKQNLDDVTIHDPFAIQLSGVKFKTQVQGRLDRDASGLIVEAALKNLEISIDRISIHTVVDMHVSGVDAHVRIDAECTGTKMSWRNRSMSLFTRARLQTRPGLALQVSDLALPADLTKPEMTLSCSGPFGIETVIRDQAWAALQARWVQADFARSLEQKIESTFLAAVRPGSEGISLLNSPEMKMTIRPDAFVSTTAASHMKATVDISLDRPVALAREKVKLVAPIPAGEIDRLTLSLPAAAAERLLHAWFTPGVWSEWVEGQKVEGFRELMSSRFKQFFAWPDLMNYDQHAPFWFVMSLQSKPTLRCGANGVDVKIPMMAQMLHQDSKFEIGYKPMINFGLPTSIVVNLPQATAGRSTTVGIQDMSLNAKFDDRYVKIEEPDTTIDTDAIGDAVREFANETAKDLTLIEGAVGTGIKMLNQTDATCDSTQQALRLKF